MSAMGFDIETTTHYKKVDKLGEGTYGIVYKALNIDTGEYVAIKKIKLDQNDEGMPSTTLREISILKNLNHPCIVELKYCNFTKGRVHLIFEYLDQDLKQYLDSLESGAPDTATIKSLMYQLIDGLYACHAKRFFHRDLKPQNLLVQKGRLKIADFGLGREHGIPIDEFTHEIVTLWYRSPELLLSSTKYSGAVDVWSVGCIMAELYLKEAFFMGDCEIDQLYQIFMNLGTPTNLSWPGVENLSEYKSVFPRWKKKAWSTMIPTGCVKAHDLLNKALEYEPSSRIYAKNMLKHPYFNDVKLPTGLKKHDFT